MHAGQREDNTTSILRIHIRASGEEFPLEHDGEPSLIGRSPSFALDFRAGFGFLVFGDDGATVVQL
ncbi:hypothetical protein QJS04_geneDACA013985 [Acorus gramineus]|uniref:Uncharacterized protein n=1 Tax=Acorus gramineus TaxID=55184 RepID=A0AAV9AX53_ACOGR|nr:hypothetical protein QJS04_geneDACA013985 [Acorus gramineus]